MATPQNLNVVGVSGRFDRPDSLVLQSSRFLRRMADVIGRTEHKTMTASQFNYDGLHWLGQKVGEYILETRNSKLRPIRAAQPYAYVVSRISYKRIAKNGGGKTPPFTVGVFPMQTTGPHPVKVAFVVGHAATIEGRLRLLANLDCLGGIAKLSLSLQSQGYRVVFIGDLNRDARKVADAALVTRLLLKPGHLVDVWIGKLPAKGGTHGALNKKGVRPVIDWVITNGIVRGRRFIDDGINDSDHHPYAAVVDVANVAVRLRRKRR